MRYREVRSSGNESIVVGAVLFMIFLLQAPPFFSASNHSTHPHCDHQLHQ